MNLRTLAFGASLSLIAPLAHAEASDRADAERLLATVAADESADTAKSEVEASKAALERAKSARDAKDVHHGEMLESLAKTFAQTASDLLAAIAAEAKAAETQQSALDTHAQVDRQKTLLEEAISRRGRARVELDRAEADAAAKTPQPAPKDRAAPKKAAPRKDKGAKK
jgi:hypothetical protein